MNLVVCALLALSGFVDQPTPITPPKVEPVPKPPFAPIIQVSPPVPVAVTELPADRVFVDTTPERWVVLASPDGIVNITEEQVPESGIKYRARFVGGNGNLETRTFDKGKWLYSIEPIAGKSGDVELIITPVGGTSKDIRRQKLMVGQAPQPPPVPNPVPPGPAPAPTPKAVGKLSIVAVLDRKVADPAQAQALVSDALRTYLAAAGDELDLIDTGTMTGQQQSTPYNAFANKAGITGPYLLVMDLGSKPAGNVLAVVPLPSKDTDTVALLKSLAGK